MERVSSAEPEDNGSSSEVPEAAALIVLELSSDATERRVRASPARDG
jgi:hypothetical protein